jgi:hypothetical protein
VILLLLIGIFFFIRSPWGQDLIVQKATKFVSGKTGTTVSLDRLFITFRGNIYLEGLFLDDLRGDTLAYVKELETGLKWMPLIREGAIHVSRIDLEGLHANIALDSASGKFNFDFLIDTFVSRDTSTVPNEPSPFPEIDLGPIDLKRVRVAYLDGVGGMDVEANWDRVQLEIGKLDLNKMDFAIGEAKIDKADIRYVQHFYQASDPDTTSESFPLPLVSLEKLEIAQSKFLYQSSPDGILANIDLGSLSLSLPEANLEAQKILLSSLLLADAHIALQMAPQPASESSALTSGPAPFTWPDWWIEVGSIEVNNSQLDYVSGSARLVPGLFNAENIQLADLQLDANNLYLRDEQLRGNLRRFSFQERSGLLLRQLSVQLDMNDRSLRLDNLLAETNRSKLAGRLGLDYMSLGSFIENPERAAVAIEVSNVQTSGSEALFFAPELARDDYFREFMKNGIRASGKLNGNQRRLSIPRFDLGYGSHTKLHVGRMTLDRWMQPEKIKVSAPDISFRTKGRVLEPFLDGLEYEMPDDIFLRADVAGDIENAKVDLALETSDGNVFFGGNLHNGGIYEVDSKLRIQDLDIGKILAIPDFSPISLETNLVGKGSGLYDLEGMVSVACQRLEYKGKDLSDLVLRMDAKDTLANVTLVLAEDFLDVDLGAKIRYDTLNPSMDVKMDVKLLDLYALGLVNQNVQLGFKMQGQVAGLLDDLSLMLQTGDGYFQADRKSYPIGDIRLEARMATLETDVKLFSDFLWGNVNVEGDLAQLAPSITQYFDYQVFGNPYEADAINLKAQAKLDFRSTPFLDQMLLPDLQGMDTVHFDLSYDANRKEFRSTIELLWAQYLDARLDSFDVEIIGTKDLLTVDMGFKKLEYSPVSMDLTGFEADFRQGIGDLSFFSKQGETLYNQIAAELEFIGDTVVLRVNPEGLLFNKEAWTTPTDNEVVYAPKYLDINNFNFSNSAQRIGFRTDDPNIRDPHVALEFENYDINTLIGFLNPDDPLAKGIVDGEVAAIDPFRELGLLADMNIKDFEVMSVPLGRLDLGAKASSLKSYDFSLALKEGKVDMDILGALKADTVSTNLDLQVNLNALQLSLLEILSDSAIREGKGIITGNIKLDGTLQDPRYVGELRFKDAGLLVTDLNTRFTMENEAFRMENAKFVFDKFTIKDEVGDAFVIDGNFDTSDPTNPSLDLRLNTKEFQVMNSTRKDNDLFFGHATVDLDMKIGGTVNLPVIKMQLKVNEGTEVSFIVPEDQVDMVERTGVVLFVNQQDPYDILYKREGDFRTKGLAGYDVHANLRVDPKTVFNLIVDERTGDNLRLQGEADLNMVMNPNGDISLSGRYQVGSGHYEMNLFGLVNRRFELAQGSTVIWTGEPMMAKLDLRAIYNVRTSAAELMQAQLSGTTNDTRSQFRQVLPFMVYLNVEGEILKPEISFALDMAENERGAFGGSVYGMIQQINEKDDELTKQVFSLLVLNQFFPVMGNDGSGGGSVNLARSSVSQVLSSQLNALSDKLFGNSGFSVDFNLDSYQDFQSGTGEDRTQLSVAAKQSLFDDRLVISVGGQMDVEGGNQQANQGEAMLGDFSLEYLLDSRGKWRAKAYRKNTFESVIDGQLIVTGVSFIFNKEFNEFVDLWRKSAQEMQIKEEEKKRRETRKLRKKEKKQKQ